MLDPKEYAEKLMKTYFVWLGGVIGRDKIVYIGTEKWKEAKQCALIDLQNTIDALNMTHESEFSTLDSDFLSPKLKALIEHFNQVKEHIKQLYMETPETTPERPYIEFRFDKNGKLSLKAVSHWWGGKNQGFFSSDGSEGNTARPEKLGAYMQAFKERKIKSIEKEILTLQNKLNRIKNYKLTQ